MPIPAPTPAPPERRHVLIIEDDLLTGMDLQAMLQALGYDSFAFASTQEQAIEQARLQSPDLATVDVGLLDGDGLLAARALNALCGDLPTVFITGDPQRVLEADPGGVVLGKPVCTRDLRRAVGEAERAVRRPLRSIPKAATAPEARPGL